MALLDDQYKKALAEMEAQKKELDKKTAEYNKIQADAYSAGKPTAYGPLGPLPSPTMIDIACERLMEEMKRVRDEQKKSEQYTRITEPVNILILPDLSCAECMELYEVSLEPDGIRLRFRHNRKDGCSRQMTQFHRPLAVFMKEI